MADSCHDDEMDTSDNENFLPIPDRLSPMKGFRKTVKSLLNDAPNSASNNKNNHIPPKKRQPRSLIRKSEAPRPAGSRPPADTNYIKVGFGSKIAYNESYHVGTGATGVVYHGYYEVPTCHAAVKMMTASSIKIYTNEVQILRELQHPNVVRYFATATTGTSFYIAMELANDNLEAYIKTKESIPWNIVQGYLFNICDALEQMHSKCVSYTILHRDIKPSNVLLFNQENQKPSEFYMIAKLSDFGISKRISNYTLNHPSTAKGTQPFMSPECLQAHDKGMEFISTKESDIYSLGLTFFHALTNGKHACGSTIHQVYNLAEGRFDINSLYDLNSRKITAHNLINSMLSLDPSKRPTIEEVRAHPFFWKSSKSLGFLVNVANFMKGRPTDTDRTVLDAAAAHLFPCTEEGYVGWTSKLDKEIVQSLSTLKVKKKYDPLSCIKLIEFIRDKDQHYVEWPATWRKYFGESEDSYISYFLDRFPFLTTFLYCYLYRYRSDRKLSKYYIDFNKNCPFTAL